MACSHLNGAIIGSAFINTIENSTDLDTDILNFTKNYPKLKIVVIKYNAGNVRSVENAINRLNLTCSITDDPEIIKSADKVIFPGVGHAVPTMKYLKERKLDKVIKELKQPILGICLGQQLMCAHSEEGDVDCLNIFQLW